MKNYFLIFIGLSILACSDDNIESLSEPNAATATNESFKVDPVLSFDDWDSFYKIYNEISKLDEQELILWATDQPHTALILSLNKNEELQEDIDILTNGLLGILNDKMEFEVGKNIIHFKKGNFYSIPIKEYTDTDIWNKDILNNLSIVGNAQKRVLTSENTKTKNESRTELGLNDIKGSYQREFIRQTYRKCSGGAVERGTKFKYVHELVSKSFSVGYPVVVIELYIDVKLEWRSSKWRAAGEDRHITIALSGTAEVKTLPTPVYFNINRTLNCVNRNQRILIASSQYATNIGLAPRNWIVNAQGSITQEINYDSPSNKWINYITW